LPLFEVRDLWVSYGKAQVLEGVSMEEEEEKDPYIKEIYLGLV